MVSNRNKDLTREIYLSVVNLMVKQGYLPCDYREQAKTIKTDVPCPFCGVSLDLNIVSSSHMIICETKDCYKSTTRGL